MQIIKTVVSMAAARLLCMGVKIYGAYIAEINHLFVL